MAARSDLCRSLSLVVLLSGGLAGTALPAQSPETSTRAADRRDPLLDRLHQLNGIATGSIVDPSARKLLQTLQAAMQAEAKARDDTKDARFGALATGESGEGGYDSAEGLLRLAVDRDERVLGPDHPGTATGLDRLAKRLIVEQRFAEAEPLLRRAAAIDEKRLPDHPRTGEIFGDLARALIGRGALTEAEPLLRRAAAIQEKALGANSPYLAQTLTTLAELLQRRAEDREAEKLFRRALGIDETSLGAGTVRVAEDLEGLAELIARQGRYDEAVPLLVRAVRINAAIYGDEDPDTARIAMELAFAAFALSRNDAAVELLRPACRVLIREATGRGAHGATRQKSGAQASTCASGLAQILWQSSRVPKLPADRVATMRAEAFDAAQLSQISSAAESLSHYGARSAAAAAGVGAEADAYEAALGERDDLDIAIAQATGDQAGSGAQALPALQAARDGNSRKIDGAAAALKTVSPRYWDYRSPEPVTIGALRARAGEEAVLLHDDEALILLMLAPGSGKGLIFAVSKQGSAWAEAGLSGSEIDAHVQKLRMQIDPGGYRQRSLSRGAADRPASGGEQGRFDLQTAYALYQALLGDPAIQAIVAPKSTLLFVPSGAMTSLPPSLLVTSPPGGDPAAGDDQPAYRKARWLLRDKAVAVLPSVSALRTLRQILPASRKPATDPLLALADPDFASPDGTDAAAANLASFLSTTPSAAASPANFLRSNPPAALPGTRIEALALQRGLGAEPSSLLLGPSASKAELVARNDDGRLARVRVLEFATHATFAGEIPGLSEPALILAAATSPGDEIFTASEAAMLRLNADWVLLSACDTGSPDRPGAPGLSGLSRAFLFAGARSMLVSHWHVRDDITARLIPAVILAERDAPGLSRAQALRSASLAILDDVSLDAAAPSAWAPFVLLGEPGR